MLSIVLFAASTKVFRFSSVAVPGHVKNNVLSVMAGVRF